MPDPVAATPAAALAAQPAVQRPRATRVSNSASYRDGLGDSAGITDRQGEDKIARLLNPKVPENSSRTPERGYDDLTDDEKAERDAELDRRERNRRESPRVAEEREAREADDGLGDGETVNEEVVEPIDSLDPDEPAVAGEGGEEDFEEIDYTAPNGKAYKVPKALVDGAMRQQRFTQVMEENAAARQYLAAQQQQVELDRSMFTELEPINGQIRQIDAWVAQLQKQLPDVNDPANIHDYLKLEKQIRSLTDSKAELQGAAAKRGTELSAQKQALVEALQGAADRLLAKALPKWNDKVKAIVSEQLVSYGYTPQEIAVMHDPRLIHAVHDAALYHRTKANRAATLKQVQAAPPIVRPQGRPSTANTQATQTRAVVREARRTGDPKSAEAAITRLLQNSRKRN